MVLYYITDRRAFAGTDAEQRVALLRCIASAARAGVDYIQLREKDLSSADLELLARQALHVVRDNSAQTRLLINTHADIALSVGADGVHLPAGSSSCREVRNTWNRVSNTRPFIGVSVHSVAGVQLAEIEGASFVVLAPVFEKVAAGTKGIGVEILRQACAAAALPVLALGGVRLGNARECLAAGAAGIAGIRLFQENSVSQTVAALRWLEQQAPRAAS